MSEECRACDKQMPAGANFCPKCGAPQNEKAAQALQRFMDRQNEPERETRAVSNSRTVLVDRLGYAFGWVALIAGFVLLPDAGGAFVTVGGVFALPPLRSVLGRLTGAEVGPLPMFAAASLLVALGLGLVAAV